MSLQSYNRYSYVMNNPLTLVDPSGFIFGTPLSTSEYFGSVFSGLGQGGVEVASSFRRSAEGLGTMAGLLSVDPIGTVTAAHDQLTTNLANGYELAASTTVSDISRDLSNAGSMYANNENGFRDEVNDMTTGTAITLAAGEALKPVEAAIKSKAGELLKRLDNAAPETRAAPEVQEQAPLQRQPEQQQAQQSQVDPRARGRESEKRVLADIGEAKNTKVETTSHGDTIPDFQNSKQVGEIKDRKVVADSAQLRGQKELAQRTGREHVTITGEKSTVTDNAARNTRLIRRKDLGPQE